MPLESGQGEELSTFSTNFVDGIDNEPPANLSTSGMRRRGGRDHSSTMSRMWLFLGWVVFSFVFCLCVRHTHGIVTLVHLPN